MKASHQISCKKFTCAVDIDSDGTIKDAAPIIKKFVGQNIRDLLLWCLKISSGVKLYNLETLENEL